MTGYRKIDMAAWPRREHYQYYTEKLKIECNMTVPINVKNLLDFCHESGHKFYPSIIYLVTKVLNQMENFRMFRDAEGNLCVWDQVVPNYTIFHEDDKTFSDCWTGYSDDFETFYREITEDMEKGQEKRGIKVKSRTASQFLLHFLRALGCIYGIWQQDGQQYRTGCIFRSLPWENMKNQETGF